MSQTTVTDGSQLLILTDRNYPSDRQTEMFGFEEDIGAVIASWADGGFGWRAREAYCK